MNCLDYSKLLEFLSKQESILVLVLILVTIVSLIVFSNNPLYLFLVNALLLIGYFSLSKREDKKVIALGAINFAFWGVILESFIIKKTNFALRYKQDMGVLYVPAWLFTIYMIFMISAIFTYDCFKVLIK
tara:strand:+ start:47 stop:436 length:390 start_codon:yes stop_codon:yes gene_type:complete